MKDLKTSTKRGILLDGVLFGCENERMRKCGSADTSATDALTQSRTNAILIAITGIHGNFYSNPFYYTVGDTLTASGYDFLYAQACDAFGTIRTPNTRTGQTELIGSWNERFAYAEEDVAAWIDWAERHGYRHIYLAGHSLGANKVIRYLSRQHDPRVERFLLLSPANLDYMTSVVTPQERDYVRRAYEAGRGAGALRGLAVPRGRRGADAVLLPDDAQHGQLRRGTLRPGDEQRDAGCAEDDRPQGRLRTHSQGGRVGWATDVDNIAAIIAVEPGFAPQIGSPEYQKFVDAKVPMLFLFGDYIENGPADIQSTGFWQMVLNQCREFAAQYVADGGDATVVYLPDQDIHGNSHFMFQEKNNTQLADLVADWLAQHGLK